jgi:hypothetical protein
VDFDVAIRQLLNPSLVARSVWILNDNPRALTLLQAAELNGPFAMLILFALPLVGDRKKQHEPKILREGQSRSVASSLAGWSIVKWNAGSLLVE